MAISLFRSTELYWEFLCFEYLEALKELRAELNEGEFIDF